MKLFGRDKSDLEARVTALEAEVKALKEFLARELGGSAHWAHHLKEKT